MVYNQQQPPSISRKELFSTVFAQQFSPCGNYLVAGNSLGRIAIYHITNTLSVDAAENPKFPSNVFQTPDSCIFCMASDDRFLVTGGSTQINGWLWNEVVNQKVWKAFKSLTRSRRKEYTFKKIINISHDETSRTCVRKGLKTSLLAILSIFHVAILNLNFEIEIQNEEE